MSDEIKTEVHPAIVESKSWRQELDVILQKMKGAVRKSRSRSLSITHLEDSIMRLGLDLKDMKEEGLSSEPNPYPDSYNANNGVIEKTADGLKL